MSEYSDHVAALIGGLSPYHDAFRPVLRPKDGSNRRRVEGTATVVGDGDQRFVVTAHHVVKGPQSSYLGVREQEPVEWPRKYSRLNALEESLPDADIAWAHARVVPGASPLEAALPMALARAAVQDSSAATYVAVGYPASKAKVQMGEGTAAAKIMFALVELAGSDRIGDLSFDPRAQVALTYSQEGRADRTGAPIVGAHPKGMSGGAVFVIGRSKVAESLLYVPFLIGILTEFHEDRDLLVATRINLLWRAIGAMPGDPHLLYRPAEQSG